MANAKKPKSRSSSTTDALFDRYWETPDDVDALRVYADALVDAGDPRGEFIHLCLAKSEAAGAFETRHRAALVEPARGLFREVDFGPNGLVSNARTEVDKVIANIAALGRISPRLMLSISSVRTIKDAQQLGKVALGRIFLVDFTGMSGGSGGMITDKQLAAFAPALAGVRCLALPIRGRAAQTLSPAGLQVLGQTAKQLEFLSLQMRPEADVPPAGEFARGIADALPTLKALNLPGAKPSDVGIAKIAVNQLPRPTRRSGAIEIAQALAKL